MKKRYCSVILILFFALTTLTVYANESTVLLFESRVSDQSVVLYTRNQGSADVQARIAFQNITDITVDGQDGTLPITTWLLLDNSFSISQSDLARGKQLLTDLVSSRAPKEVFTFCTFSDHLNPIVLESQDYSELRQAIDTIQHNYQDTYLTDCLDELLALEAGRTDARYVRVVVISDGVDNNPGGITRDELMNKLEENNIPIYSLGTYGNAQELKEMYAISRQTGAKYWTLSETQDSDIIYAMSHEEIPIRITLPIPASLCDGTTKGVHITFENGTTLQTQVDMPFGAIVMPTPGLPVSPSPTEVLPTPPPTKEPEEEHTAADWMREHWLLIVILSFIIVSLAIGGFLLLHLTKTRKNAVLEDAHTPARDERAAVPPPGSIFLGRDKEGNNITIDNPLISKRHCAIAVSGERITVYDLNSLNGTLVDNVPVEKGGYRQAWSGSTLTLANSEFEMAICSVAPDYFRSGGDTLYMKPEDAMRTGPGKRVLRVTDLSRRDRCYEVPLPDAPYGNTPPPDGTVFMG